MRRFLITASAVGLVAVAAGESRAALLVYDLGHEFSGGTSPAGVAPWVRVSFDDNGVPGTVKMKVQSLSLTGSEFLTDLLVNLNPALDPTNLVFGTETQSGAFALPTKAKGANAINGNTAGQFDLGISFDNSPPGNRFGSGDTYEVTLTGIGTLAASSFQFNSLGGGNGPLPISAHIQGIGANGNLSGKITVGVPEPTTLAAGLFGATLLRRRR